MALRAYMHACGMHDHTYVYNICTCVPAYLCFVHVCLYELVGLVMMVTCVCVCVRGCVDVCVHVHACGIMSTESSATLCYFLNISQYHY